MRLNHRSAPLRFVAATLAGWSGLRAALLIPWIADAPPVQLLRAAVSAGPIVPAPPAALASRAVATPAHAVDPSPLPAALVGEVPPDSDARLLMLAAFSGGRSDLSPALYVMPDRFIPATPGEPLPPAASGRLVAGAGRPVRRWSGSAWVYARSGSGAGALAAGGQLGGSQAGLRVAYRLDRHLAAVARVSAALGVPGKEAALGLDWSPGLLPVRLSVEQRIALDRGGRTALAAYAAAGFYGQERGVVVDGYGQAGIVGVHARDLFADGALRVARPVAGDASLGAGLWAAAQPGVARIDLGPRAALRLPGDVATLAIESRLRVAGDARPGSGVAVTLAKDF